LAYPTNAKCNRSSASESTGIGRVGMQAEIPMGVTEILDIGSR